MAIPKQYLGAFKAGHRASSREFIDEELSYSLLKRIIDSNYTDQAAMDQLAYITKFNNEFHKNVIKKGDKKALHNTKELRKDCYARENARNRDISSREHNFMQSLEPTSIHTENGETIKDGPNAPLLDQENHEDNAIEIIDIKYNKLRRKRKKR